MKKEKILGFNVCSIDEKEIINRIFLDYQNKLKNFGGLYKYDILNARYRLIKYINQITNILNLEDMYKNGGQLEWELN